MIETRIDLYPDHLDWLGRQAIATQTTVSEVLAAILARHIALPADQLCSGNTSLATWHAALEAKASQEGIGELVSQDADDHETLFLDGHTVADALARLQSGR